MYINTLRFYGRYERIFLYKHVPSLSDDVMKFTFEKRNNRHRAEMMRQKWDRAEKKEKSQTLFLSLDRFFSP